jgi:DNA-binding response OmpR family regulator
LPAPRILIVDDQRDISRMLRAALETLGRGYVIVDVPSAEEAQLEFRRAAVDLLITDLRLPGISGLELIRRLHKGSNAAQIFVISAYADEIAQAEFRDLGATFFAKPLDLHNFLRHVVQALAGHEVAANAAEAAANAGAEPPARVPPARDEQANLADRLARLRRDVGALAACLVSLEGRIVAQAGDTPNLYLPALTPPLMASFRASQLVSRALGGHTPANAQIFDGAAYAAYSANVGDYFALLMVFDGQRVAGQMGPVLRYGRLAADDLLNILRNMGITGGNFPAAAVLTMPAAVARAVGLAKTAPLPPLPPEPPRRKKTGPLRKKTGPLPELPPAPPPAAPAASLAAAPAPAPADPAPKTTSQAAADYWDNVAGADIGDHRADTLTWEQAAKLGIVLPKP